MIPAELNFIVSIDRFKKIILFLYCIIIANRRMGKTILQMTSLIITISLTVKQLQHKVSILNTLNRNGIFLWHECVMKRICCVCVYASNWYFHISFICGLWLIWTYSSTYILSILSCITDIPFRFIFLLEVSLVRSWWQFTVYLKMSLSCELYT